MEKVKTGVAGQSIKDSDINKIYEVGIYGLSIFELLKQNKFYQNYSNLYD